ncbi:MAG: O-acetyl-ADP-ribose deacetylase, partial [Bacteroidota bacterium]|nr:O-acetyl-ADP-ribose deacetylase [Bacteroidota bacterium]
GQLLAEAYINSMEIAVNHGIKSIAFPNISTGIYGFPKKIAAEIAIAEVCEFLRTHNTIEKVIFCCFEHDNYEIYKELMKDLN